VDKIRLGFTGTQLRPKETPSGMTDAQKRGLTVRLQAAVKKYGPGNVEFHHGDCIGADAEAHEIAVSILGVDAIWIHPGSNSQKRAHKWSPHILPPDDNLDRNRTMVRVTDGMIAAPRTMVEQFRGSGTWMTIREARNRQKKPLTILRP
jgi:hypothetical protein